MKRFAFGKNWLSFCNRLPRKTLYEAKENLCLMLEQRDLTGKRFLDIGCGSGVFSVAAHNLGAKVCAFDYDADSVAASSTLRDKNLRERRERYIVLQGDVLDKEFMAGLGVFDIVYAWGCLHHTGRQWEALGNACEAVAPDGILYISLYNDQGRLSSFWRKVKQIYNSSKAGKIATLLLFMPPIRIWQFFSARGGQTIGACRQFMMLSTGLAGILLKRQAQKMSSTFAAPRGCV